MTASHSDLSAEVGPDHHFLIVPAVGEYLSLIAKGGLWARRGPAECSSLGLVAPAMLIIRIFAHLALWPILASIPPLSSAPYALLTIANLLARCRFAPCRR